MLGWGVGEVASLTEQDDVQFYIHFEVFMCTEMKQAASNEPVSRRDIPMKFEFESFNFGGIYSKDTTSEEDVC